MSNLKTLEVTRIVDGVTLTAKVDPCAWMYENYGLQVSVFTDSGERIHRYRRDIKFHAATEDNVRALLDGVSLCACKTCGKPTFSPAIAEHLKGECQACITAEADAQFAKQQNADSQKLAEMDKKFKAEGFTHRVDAWIHPSAGGSDRMISFYIANQPKNYIESRLRNEGSMVVDDYTLTAL